MNKPTDEQLEQLRIRIAELYGWKNIDWVHYEFSVFNGKLVGTNKPGGDYEEIPDYCRDLNAIHEAEKMLTNEQMGRYLQKLAVEVLPKTPTENLRDILPMHAEAWQRAIALDRTLSEKPIV